LRATHRADRNILVAMNDNAVHDDLRFRVLRALQSNPNLTHKGLAKELSVSAGSVNYCLRALVDKGIGCVDV
jgi:DNA-binding Lrp family transcriptional regulator